MTPRASLCGYVVEWVRSCYRSAWKLTEGSSEATRGQYCFAPPGTPHYEELHNLGSRNYTTDDFETGPPTMGEVRTGKQVWHSGLTPEPFPFAQLLGTEDDLLAGGNIDYPRAKIPCGQAFTFWLDFPAAGDIVKVEPTYGDGEATADIFYPRDGQTYQTRLHWPIGSTNPNDFRLSVTVNGLTLTRAPSGPLVCPIGGFLDFEFDSPNWPPPSYGQNLSLSCYFDPPRPTPQICPELYQGFWPACYIGPAYGPASEPINFPDIAEGRDQLLLAKMIVKLYDDPAAAQVMVQDYLGPTATVTVYPDGPDLVPGCVIGVRDDYTLAISTGTTNFFQAAMYSWFSLLSPYVGSDYTTNLVWRIAATALESRILAAGGSPTGRITLAGHSYGGALCCVAGADFLLFNPSREVDVISYGGAVPGDSRLSAILRRGRVIRISNVGDPVPFLPPPYSYLYPYLTVLPLTQVQHWTLFEQPLGQWLLDENGVKTETEVTSLSLSYLALAIQSFLVGPALTTPFAHFSAEYVRRLKLALVVN